MKLAFILGDVSTADHGNIDPEAVFSGTHRALTGSEGSLLYLARELTKRHEVTVYCKSRFEWGSFDGILYRASELGVDPDHDFYVAMSEPDMLNGAPVGRRICWQQQNNFDYMPKGYDAHVDAYVALSPVHREHMIANTKTDAGKWMWIPNGIDTARFDRELPRRPHSMAWLSSPDRGLHHLLSMWPEIRQRVPDATLRIFYRFDPWLARIGKHPRMTRGGARAAYIKECLHRLGRKGENGVIVVGDVPNAKMADELLQTQVYAYPCDPVAFTEGFGVAVLDAVTAGCYPIVSEVDALGDIYADVADVISDKPLARRARWIAEIVRALTEDDRRAQREPRGRAWGKMFDISRVAAVWEKLFLGQREAMPKTIRAFVGQTNGTNGANRRPARAPTPSTMRVDFCMNQNAVYPRHGNRGFDPFSLFDAPRGLSGTDINFFGSAQALARRGHKVRVFAPFIVEARADGVEYLQYARFPTISDPADVTIAHYDAAALEPSRAKLNVIVQHTITIPSPEFYATGKVHVNLSPSRVNMEHLKAAYAPNLPWHVLPNANDLGNFKPHQPVYGRMIFHTSPERGLHLLLRALPEIRRRVPEAHVRFVGDLSHVDDYIRYGGRGGAICSEIKAGLAQHADVVTVLPRSSRNIVLSELSQAAVFAYPSDPPIPCEVFPVSVLDCLRAGVPVVMQPADGIEEIFKDSVALVGDLDHFIDTTVAALSGGGAFAEALSRRGRAFAENYTFDKQAEQLEQILRQHLHLHTTIGSELRALELPAYMGA